jgi:cadmium resistance transport/sequestration family protein
MGKLVEVIITAIASFAATNLDDIIILMIFFAQVNSTFRRKHIICGQYLGFTVIIIASLPGFFGGLILPKAWIGLLALLPIVIGVSRLVNRGKNNNEVQTVSKELNSARENTSMVSIFASLLSPQTYQVATVTFANGGDNIGIYVPLFANNNLAGLGVIFSVFYMLIGVYCYVAYQLTRHSAVAHILTRYGHAIAPFILIALGIFILLESGSYLLISL